MEPRIVPCVGGQGASIRTKLWGRGAAPLTPEYQKIFEDSMAIRPRRTG